LEGEDRLLTRKTASVFLSRKENQANVGKAERDLLLGRQARWLCKVVL